MALNTFGGSPSDVLTNSAGDVVARYTGGANAGQPIRLTVWTSQDRSTQVTTLYAMDGVTALPGYVTPVTSLSSPNYGRVMFRASDAHSALWLWDGNPASDPWLVWARETPGKVSGAVIQAEQATADAAAALEAADEAVVNASSAASAASSAALSAAAAENAAESVATFTAVRYGDDGDAIQQALDLVHGAGGGIVTVTDKGSPWMLSAPLVAKAGVQLRVHPSVVIKAGPGASPMLLNGDADAAGYSGEGAITVQGGIWDCGGATASGVRTGFALAHARGITVRDLTIKDVGSGHAIELNSIDGAVIDNVRFDGFYNTNGRDDTEAVQIDCARAGNFPWFGPNDSTVTKNVTISNCWVGNTGGGSLWWRGFGGHNTVVDDPYTGITVTGNHVRTRSTGVRAYNWSQFVIASNTFEGGGVWIQATEVARTGDTINKAGTQTSASADVGDGTVTANVFDPAGITMQYHAFWLSGEATGKIVRVTVTGNVVKGTNSSQHGIRAFTTTAANISNNTVAGTNAQGISLQDASKGLVTGNRVLGAGSSAGIHVTGASDYSTITNNLVTDSQQAGILLSGTSHQCSIKGNTVIGSSAQTNSGYNAIHLSGVDDCQVLNNTVRKNPSATNHASAALFINSACDRTWHTLNDFRSSSNSAAINDAGTASVTTAGNVT